MPILWGSELEYWSCCMWYELGSLHLEVIVAGGDRASHNDSPAISLRMWCHQVSAWLISSICLSTQYRLYLKRILVFLLIMAGYIENRQGIHEVNYFSNPQSSHFSMKKNILPDFREEKFFQTLSVTHRVLSHWETDCGDVSPKKREAWSWGEMVNCVVKMNCVRCHFRPYRITDTTWPQIRVRGKPRRSWSADGTASGRASGRTTA